MKRKLNLVVDLKIKQYNPLILKQMDTTELEFKILDDGLDVNFTDLSADIIFTKPNKTIVIQNATIEDNIVKVTLLQDCLRMSGKANIEVELKKDTEIVSSFYIPVQIESTSKENIHSDNTPNYIEALEDAIILETQRQQNEKERQEAENTRKTNETKRIAAETARANAEVERNTAEQERITNENNRKSAETIRNTNETNRTSAENERIEAENARVEEFNNMKDQVKPILRYTLVITEEIAADTNFSIPCYYKVGENVLDIYYMGEKLIKTTDDIEGNYKEIGETGSISNIIQLDGWSAGDLTDIAEYFEFVVRR